MLSITLISKKVNGWIREKIISRTKEIFKTDVNSSTRFKSRIENEKL